MKMMYVRCNDRLHLQTSVMVMTSGEKMRMMTLEIGKTILKSNISQMLDGIMPKRAHRRFREGKGD